MSSQETPSPSPSPSPSLQQQHAVHRLHRIISQVQPHSSHNHLIQHLTSSSSSPSSSSSSTSALSETEMGPPRGTTPLPADPLRFLGWGYRDTTFYLNQQGQVALSGSRYLFSGRALPSLRAWMEEHCGLNISYTSPPQTSWSAPSPIRNESFLKSIEGFYHHIEWSERDRIHHSHGHTAQELFAIRHGTLTRVVDVVIYPGSHAHVEIIVKAATQHNVAIIPFGGGTSVSHALVCDSNEKRMIVSLDMHMMNAIKHINRHNMTATIEAGAVGKDIDRELRSMGLVLGHEPDSSEFSTMGGWIATRASGMRKNKYGNIEDIIIHIKMVTPTGTVEKSCQVPRISAGPDVHQMILGSEGTLGVVTEAIVRLRPAPQVTLYGSMIFPCFEDGVACMHAIAMARCAPVSIRLVDNTQFQFGQALKPATEDWKKNMIEKAKKWYVLHRLKFDPNRMVAATLLFEGTSTEVAAQEKQVYSIAAKYGGMKAGEDNGVRGYFLTYMIAYLRDFGFAYSFLSESFETSCPWDRVLPLCTAVKQRIRDEATRHGIGQLFVSCRVTQTYDTGACVYFYFGFVYHGLPNPVHIYESVEHAAREEILAQGGSISHHHGVGKLRAAFMDQTIGTSGMHMLRTLKQGVDPKNIMAAGNLNLDGKASQHGKH